LDKLKEKQDYLFEQLFELKGKAWVEYLLFSQLRTASDKDLEKDMRDSDFDALTDGKHDKQWCIDMYRSRCRGRAVTAGNLHSDLRALCALAEEAGYKSK